MSHLNTKPDTLKTGNKKYNKIYAFANNIGWIYRRYSAFLSNGLADKASSFTDEVLTTIKNLSTKITNTSNDRLFTSCEFFPKTIVGGETSTVSLLIHSDVPLTITGSPTVVITNTLDASQEVLVVDIVDVINEEDIVTQSETGGSGEVIYAVDFPEIVVSGASADNFEANQNITVTGGIFGVDTVLLGKQLTLDDATVGEDYEVGEIVTQAVSGASGFVAYWSGSTTKLLVVTNITGTFNNVNDVVGEDSLTVSANTATTNAAVIEVVDLALVYTIGETVIQDTSNATGVVIDYTPVTNKVTLGSITGTFNTTDQLVGQTTGVNYIPSELLSDPITLTYSSTLSNPSIGNLVFTNASVTGNKEDTLYGGGTGTISSGTITNVPANAAIGSRSLSATGVATLYVS